MCKDFIRGNARVKGGSQRRQGEPSDGDVSLTQTEGETGMRVRPKCPRPLFTLRRAGYSPQGFCEPELVDRFPVSQEQVCSEWSLHFGDGREQPVGGKTRQAQHHWIAEHPAGALGQSCSLQQEACDVHSCGCHEALT